MDKNIHMIFLIRIPYEPVWHKVVTVAIELPKKSATVNAPSPDKTGRDSLSGFQLKQSVTLLVQSLYMTKVVKHKSSV